MKISHKFVSYTLEEFGVVEEGGIKATVEGMSGIYHMELVTDKEAEEIGNAKKE